MEVLRDGSEVRAVLLLTSPRVSMLGLSNTFCYFECKEKDGEAQKWAANVLFHWRYRINNSFVFILSSTYLELLQALVNRDWVIQALTLHGNPHKALSFLNKNSRKKREENCRKNGG